MIKSRHPKFRTTVLFWGLTNHPHSGLQKKHARRVTLSQAASEQNSLDPVKVANYFWNTLLVRSQVR